MDTQSVKKRAKLVELKNKLLDGQHVQNRQLKTWLGDDAFEQMEDDWKSQQSIRDDLASPPAEIIEYKKRLQKLTLTYSRAERLSQRKCASAEKMYHQSDDEAEKLIEFLHGILKTDLGLQIWFDRSADEDDSGLTPDSLPQVITSRSRFNQGGGLAMAKQSKQEVKIATIDRAIDDIDELDSPGPTVSEVAANSARLRAILKRQE